ncbi:MAG: transporter substrate-binding domain-containing protein, partial [Roseivirga sp.]|nr:transporter substrate-binding domain-containing protein [Roseivirga sp.]
MKSTKRKFISLTASVLLVALFWSCNNSSDQSTAQNTPKKESKAIKFDLDKIKERGSLIAVVDNSTTGYFIYRGRPMGYEYELLSRLTKSLGVDLKVVLTANIEQAFEMLNSGEADIMAYHLTITKERSKRVAFSEPHNTVRQVLVQRKPDNWRQLKIHQIDASLIRNPIDLGGEKVYTRKGSS